MEVSDQWIAAASGLAGVIVGGVLNAWLSSKAERRKQVESCVLSARLVQQELALIAETIRASLEAGRWGAILDPGLPYHRGLWALRDRPDASAWTAGRADLTKWLRHENLMHVLRPYQMIDAIGLYCWTDDPNRPLIESDKKRFEELNAAIPSAVDALDPTARLRLRWR